MLLFIINESFTILCRMSNYVACSINIVYNNDMVGLLKLFLTTLWLAVKCRAICCRTFPSIERNVGMMNTICLAGKPIALTQGNGKCS